MILERCVNGHIAIGLAPSMYSLVQETGQVDRNPLEGPGDNRYEVHISFYCLVQLYVRIMQELDLGKRKNSIIVNA